VIMVNLPSIVNEKVIRSQVTSNPSAVQSVPRPPGSASEAMSIMPKTVQLGDWLKTSGFKWLEIPRLRSE